MKIKVNRNNLWAKIFIDQLADLGVKFACISPGSRSTPLTYTLSKNRKIKSFIHVDERSSAYFALGLAKATGFPVIVITTSGTAVAELYPAIIEAYHQRIPLIVCTADRPSELIGTGANQTINQHNIYKNHIRWFRDLGLPSISESGLHHLQRIAINSFHISLYNDKGPVHLNFPFRKPLEPFSFTDEVNKGIFKIKPQRGFNYKMELSKHSARISEKFLEKIITTERGIIITGPLDYDRQLIQKVKQISSMLRYPIVADGLSQFRFGASVNDNNILSCFNSIVQSDNFIKGHDPDIIIQFGRTPTSSAIETFFIKTNAERYLLNSFGDNFDPTRNAKAVLAFSPDYFCDDLQSQLLSKKLKRQKTAWLKEFIKADEICKNVKTKVIEKSKDLNEPSIIREIFNFLPSGSSIFIGNSLPVRDLDNFLSNNSKRFTIYFNRGASGIDGVTSTALGIASRKKPIILITGDLSFLHDLNALTIAIKYSIPITIIVINNNGGGIFQSLPIAQKVKRFTEYFVTPHNLNLSGIVKSFGIDYQLITNKSNLQNHLEKVLDRNFPIVLEIRTDAVDSEDLRNTYFNEVKNKLNKEFSE